MKKFGAFGVELEQPFLLLAPFCLDVSLLGGDLAADHFDHGHKFWRKTNVTTNNVFPGWASPKAIRMNSPTSNSNNIRSRTTVTNLGAITGNGNVMNNDYYAAIRARHHLAGNTGQLVIRIRARPIRYADITNYGCNFYGDNKNIIEDLGSWKVTTKFCVPPANSTLWTYCATQTENTGIPFPWDIQDSPDAVQVEVQVMNRTWNWNQTNRTPVVVDDASILWKF